MRTRIAGNCNNIIIYTPRKDVSSISSRLKVRGSLRTSETSEVLKYHEGFITGCNIHAGMSICIACHDLPEGGGASVSHRARQEVTETLRRCEFPPRD